MSPLPLLLAVVVEWAFPLTDTCHEGLAFADGTTGVLVWGGGDEIRLTVGRGDLWDHRGGASWTEEQSYSNIVSLVRQGRGDRLKGLFRVDEPANWGGRKNPTLLPLGRIVVKVPGRTLRHGSLDPKTGLGRLEFAEGDAVELAMARGGFSMEFPPAVAPAVAFRPSTETGVWETLRNRGFEKAVIRTDGFDWKLPEDPSVSVDFTVHGHEAFLSTRRGAQPSVGFRSHADVRAESVAKWARFWEAGARVSVPDPVLQRLYDYGMYRFGAMTDPDGVPAGLQGPWLEDDRTIAWSGDYHFNVNVQECYSPAFRGGHFGNLLPLFRMILSWRPLLRENARKFVRIDDGYVLPHSVDDRGVCIGGFWTGTIDHASAIWTAALMMRYVRYSGDVAFLREGGFDFMRGVMNVSRAMMEERQGRLSIPLAPSPEWGASDVRKAVGRDPSFQLAAVHRLARDLADAATLLGEAPDPMWADVDRRLPPYTADADGISLFAGQPFTESHRHHSHLAGFYPFDTIDVDAARPDGVLQKSYETWVRRGTDAWTGWCVPWASVLNVHFGNPIAAVRLLHDWDAFFCDPGHGSHHDAWTPGFSSWTGHPEIMQMDGQCGAATAVLELLAHEVGGKVGFFRGCPAEWTDVSFENLALSDGTRVDGRRLNGKVTVVRRPADSPVKIESEVRSAAAETEALQAGLAKTCRLTDYAARMRRTDEGEVWTDALEAALRENEIVVIPAREAAYLIDRPVTIPSNRRIEAHGATVRLAADVRTVLLRNASVRDGTLAPVPSAGRDDNIAVCGGRWEDNSSRRRGYGRSGMFNLLPRRIGNFYGVSALFCFGSADHVTVRDVTFVRCGAFAVQSGSGRAHVYERLRFDGCFADGLHLNGNLSHVLVRDVRGKVGDDLVALNAYDWLNSSIDFGPQRYVLCEDLELLLDGDKGYPAIRIQPATYRYADGTTVDCAVSDVIFRRVKGIRTFKMYLQTPRYEIGREPEWAAIGSGGNLYFEDIDIDLTKPIDLLAGYESSDPLRGHYGAFEFGANLTSVTFRNVRIRFHLDDYPLGHLATVGPKSAYYPAKDGKPAVEIFDPYVSCTVGKMTVEGLQVEGRAPAELVKEIVFDDINRDGRSTGRGKIWKIDFREQNREGKR